MRNSRWFAVSLALAAAALAAGCGGGNNDGPKPPPGGSASLKVELAPAGAVAAGVRWTVDDSTARYADGHTLGLKPGAHVVRFVAADGWVAPPEQTVTLVAGQTKVVTATFTANALAADLTVNLEPAGAVQAGASWSLDGAGLQYQDGQTAYGLTPTTHTVYFKPLSGYVTPLPESVSLSEGASSTITATYVAGRSGSLKVNLAPVAAVNAGAGWKLDSNPAVYPSGKTVTGLAAGVHQVSFTQVAGYATPEPITVTIVADQQAGANATYVSTSQATLQVKLGPSAAVGPAAQWSLDNGTQRYDSEQVVPVSPGLHTISFLGLENWMPPLPKTRWIEANAQVVETGVYTPEPNAANLAMTIEPAGARAAAATYTVDNLGTQYQSGERVWGLKPGWHTVYFSPLNGWSQPTPMSIEMPGNMTVEGTGTYVAAVTGAVQITLGPEEAVMAGARWTIGSNPTPYTSGQIVPGLRPGMHTITFTPATGFAAPPAKVVLVRAHTTAQEQVNYSKGS